MADPKAQNFSFLDDKKKCSTEHFDLSCRQNTSFDQKSHAGHFYKVREK